MNASFDDVDPLEWIGIPLGVVLALVGVMTLVGMPWQYANSIAVTVGQAAGSILLVVVGLGLSYYLYSTE